MTLVLAAVLAAASVTLEADPNHSTVGFSVKHMVVTTVRGQFPRFSSTLNWNKDDPSRSAIELKVDPSSINTNNEKRDGHLKSQDFFDVKQCPEMTFKSNRIEKSGDKYKVTGDLTMHCVTKHLSLVASFTEQPLKSPFGTSVYPASATGKLKRSERELTWNTAHESAGAIVSDGDRRDAEVEALQAHRETQS